MPNEFNFPIIDEFRANNGVVGGMFAGARLVLLTTAGARSGRPHTVPLGYLPDGGERVLVIASAGGSPRHPAWFHNVLAHPRVTVEDGTFTYDAAATVLSGAERDDAFARAVEQDSGWADYERQSGRTLPVVALAAIPGPPRFNASTPGGALRVVHDAFRRELRLIRAEVARADTTVLGAQLRVNCLTLCAGLHGHHVREDDGMFSGLEAARPDLAPVLQRLRAEHERMAVLLEQLQAVLADPVGDRAVLAAEVDRLAALVEDHLDYEEKSLIPVLDG
ncbi:deazaflavin-dependent oxidoreductase (nitroreductase family) [Actinoplanes lutulentus]|uniref:Deazaflavin-dependent oxidoreductase (Nitroreductase family) n=1 Tax=Actinoplanes lutulentus TaxID=1287878 RepID=A0A327ZCT3_9ACTN|nr:nitroreductase/quinone reductase family protein [Actinoplanes lutulentus]MBB2948260.1 deazaflavin-dependent oxidoreductase (nitroreductase family) [Actinoplanes lutulentus]RAK31242.1 deazaflavin-dependent oxidoreductase (nitroreductase family) [Actinoplanes lutulentus]